MPLLVVRHLLELPLPPHHYLHLVPKEAKSQDEVHSLAGATQPGHFCTHNCHPIYPPLHPSPHHIHNDAHFVACPHSGLYRLHLAPVGHEATTGQAYDVGVVEIGLIQARQNTLPANAKQEPTILEEIDPDLAPLLAPLQSPTTDHHIVPIRIRTVLDSLLIQIVKCFVVAQQPLFRHKSELLDSDLQIQHLSDPVDLLPNRTQTVAGQLTVQLLVLLLPLHAHGLHLLVALVHKGLQPVHFDTQVAFAH